MTHPDQPRLVNKELAAILEGHGLFCELHVEWITPNRAVPAIRGTWFPQDGRGILQVDVLIDDDVMISECFAGFGTDGLRHAFESFCTNSLHVFLAAFWNIADEEQVAKETWVLGGRPYTAYIGNFSHRASAGVTADIPDDYFGSIQRTVEAAGLDQELYWIHHFFGQVNGNQTLECLLNNEEWEAGKQNIAAQPWKSCEGFYSVRNFLILKRQDA